MYTTIPADLKDLEKGIDFIQEGLTHYKCARTDILKTMLLAEELIVKIINEGEAKSQIGITVSKLISRVTVKISCKGKEVDFKDAMAGMEFIEDPDEELDPGAESAIQAMILRAMQDKMRFSYKSGVNIAKITVGEPTQKRLMLTIGAFLAAILIGILFRLVLPAAAIGIIDSYILVPFKTVFLNALKMVMAPMIFFSVVSCISSFGDVSELGKIGVKIISYFIITTIMSVGVGVATYKLITPGTYGSLAYLSSGAAVEGEGVSILQTLINVVSDSFMGSFHEGDTLQLIFIAVVMGLAVTMLGENAKRVASFFDCASDLFLQVSMIITRFLPLMIFCAMCSMILTLEMSNFGALIQMVLNIFAGFAVLVLIYVLYAWLRTGTNPAKFIKIAWPAWLNAMTLCSSNAAIPGTMEACKNHMGISAKVYSFAIPFGATLNMNGVGVVVTVAGLFLANVFGVDLTSSDYVTLIITATLLAMGAPGIPGGALLCMSVMLGSIHVPLEGVGLIAAIFSIIDPFTAGIDVLGDVTGTYIVAKRAGKVKEVEPVKED